MTVRDEWPQDALPADDRPAPAEYAEDGWCPRCRRGSWTVRRTCRECGAWLVIPVRRRHGELRASDALDLSEHPARDWDRLLAARAGEMWQLAELLAAPMTVGECVCPAKCFCDSEEER